MSFYDFLKNFPPELAGAVDILEKEYDLSVLFAGREIHFEHGDALSVSYNGNIISVTFDSLKSAMRGLGDAMANITADNEKNPFDKFGVMIDCSRNAVMKVDYAKKVLVRLALTGYNMVMLYTEDTYELPDEPHFGYLRGAYSAEEIRELDDFAAKLGIELVGCIQTLGHLATFLRYNGSIPVRDTASVMLAEEQKTYELIGKMLDFWQTNCRSRRIHIGMDETHDLGRGRYLDNNGYKRMFDIFNCHLKKVCGMCSERGFVPMIWSDMYFRMGSNGIYYNPDAQIPEDIINDIPSEVKLVFWDYYHLDEKIYDGMIKTHFKMGKTPLMASGIWTWFRFFYDHEFTKARVLPCVEASRKNNLKEFFYTMWRDDGAYCGHDSVFAGIIAGADFAYGTAEDVERCEKLSKALKCPSYKQTLLISSMNYQCSHRDNSVSPLACLAWDDPVTGLGSFEILADSDRVYNDMLSAFDNVLGKTDELPYAAAVGNFLRAKLELRYKMSKAYGNRDFAALQKIINNEIPAAIESADIFAAEFRRQWVNHYKYNGMESMQIRIAGQKARLEELSVRLTEFVEGKVSSIPEFEVVRDDRCRLRMNYYHELAAPGLF